MFWRQAACTLALILSGTALAAGPAATDYARELHEIEEGLAACGAETSALALPRDKALHYVELLYRRSNLTRTRPHLQAAKHAADRLQEMLGPMRELTLLRARLELDLHRADRARALIPSAEGDSTVRGLAFDLAMQEGNYAEARTLMAPSPEPGVKW